MRKGEGWGVQSIGTSAGQGRSRAPNPMPRAGENMQSHPAGNPHLSGRQWRKDPGAPLDGVVHISDEVSPSAGALALSVHPLVRHLSVRTYSARLGPVPQKARAITTAGHGTGPTARETVRSLSSAMPLISARTDPGTPSEGAGIERFRAHLSSPLRLCSCHSQALPSAGETGLGVSLD